VSNLKRGGYRLSLVALAAWEIVFGFVALSAPYPRAVVRHLIPHPGVTLVEDVLGAPPLWWDGLAFPLAMMVAGVGAWLALRWVVRGLNSN
jgi:hypothetical protein